jgi:lipopolysaccharide/colanic/teichoic acid biosynthesis glycosyltransferase
LYWQLRLKRVIDVVGAAMGLILLSPFFLLTALSIKLTSRGPIFYRWHVVGYQQRSFVGYKFRTMVANADALKRQLFDLNEMSGPVFKMRNDPRITPIGRALRKLSLDELPQLWNVLKGDMSLVGPRPCLASEFPYFENWHRRKFSVKPGLTCLWQIRGRSDIRDFDTWIKLDLEYIDNWSLVLDLKILLWTIPTVLSGKGSY